MAVRSPKRRRACFRTSTGVRVVVACTVVFGAVAANLVYTWQLNRILDVSVELLDAFIPPPRHDPQRKGGNQWNPSPATGKRTTLLSADHRNYAVFHDACIYYVPESNSSIVLVQSDRNKIETVTDNATAIEFFTSIQFWQGLDFEYHNVQVRTASAEEFNKTRTAASWDERGTYMLTSHHTPENNFHLHNDFLLPVFHAHRTMNLNGLLLLQGCVSCWENRLPMMSRVLNMMGLTVGYPMEAVLTGAVMCMDRLVIATQQEKPFYSHEGRFSPFWQRELFVDYRDQVHAHFRKLLSLQRMMQQQQQPADNSTTSSTNWTDILPPTGNNTKPVLSWISRGSASQCFERCITNEDELVAELSKYFHVNMLPFQAGLTVEQSMAYIMVTNVLVGLHGAGLGYISLLPDQAIVVELKGNFGNDKKLFLNMASSLNLPYYAVNFNEDIQSSDDQVDMCTIPPDVLQSLAEEIFHAYRNEHDHPNLNASGECLFPEQVTPLNHLSSKDHSRCYLEQPFESEEWFQCVHFGICVDL